MTPNETNTTLAQDALSTLYAAMQAEYESWFAAYLAAEERIYVVSLDEHGPSRGDLLAELGEARLDRLQYLNTLTGH